MGTNKKNENSVKGFRRTEETHLPIISVNRGHVDVIIICRERVRTCDETENKKQYREVVESKIFPSRKIYECDFSPNQGHFNIHIFKVDHCIDILLFVYRIALKCVRYFNNTIYNGFFLHLSGSKRRDVENINV